MLVLRLNVFECVEKKLLRLVSLSFSATRRDSENLSFYTYLLYAI